MTELQFERRGHVGVLTLNRPERRNALGKDLLQAICDLLAELEGDRDVRALVVTGAGGKAFCAGADLKERRGMDPDEVKTVVALIGETMRRMGAFPRPTVAAVEGFALGGGLELALACDLRVASPGSLLGLTEVSLAIIPGAGGTQRLPRVIGLGHAKDLILTGRRVGGEEAHRMGLVNRLADDGAVLDAALELAEAIAANGPIALEAAKEAMDGGLSLDMEAALEFEQRCYQRVIPTWDRQEALEAFAQKRKPAFEGR